MLELKATMWLRDGISYLGNTRAFMFDVIGLSEGQEIQICEHRREWRIRRPFGEWSEQRFGSPEEALASLTV